MGKQTMATETHVIDRAEMIGDLAPDLPRMFVQSAAAYYSAFENAAVGIGHISMSGHWQYANGALGRILGYTPSELRDLTCQEMTHPNELPLDAERVLKLLAGELEHYAIDKRFLRSDGKYVWTRKTLVVKHTEAGEPDYLIALIEDIDDRKKAELENAFLVQELTHRSRNILSVISSLTSLLAPSCENVPEFEDRLLERLHAIARSNDQLLFGRHEGASMDALVRSQVSAFLGLDMMRVSVSGPEVTVNAACCQTLSLALYELTSNAFKYGALSSPGGRIALSWETRGTGDDAVFCFEWREISSNPREMSDHQGFGTTVLEKMAPMSVRGRAERTFCADGVVWTLEAPLGAVLTHPRAE